MDFSFKGSDNRVYHLSELTMGDLTDALPLWVQFRPFERFQQLKGKLPPEQFDVESNRVLMECSKKTLNFNSPEVSELAATMEGSCFLIWQSLKRNHKELSFEQVKELVTPTNFPEVNIKLQVLSGQLDEGTAKKKLEAIPNLMKESS
jgi:hypothetical protein